MNARSFDAAVLRRVVVGFSCNASGPFWGASSVLVWFVWTTIAWGDSEGSMRTLPIGLFCCESRRSSSLGCCRSFGSMPSRISWASESCRAALTVLLLSTAEDAAVGGADPSNRSKTECCSSAALVSCPDCGDASTPNRPVADEGSPACGSAWCCKGRCVVGPDAWGMEQAVCGGSGGRFGIAHAANR